MDVTGIYNPYPILGAIRVNSTGMCCIQSLDSDMMVIKTLEQLFTPWYIKRY